jgi:hypothetical protein
MPTTIEYSLLAGNAYAGSIAVNSQSNQVPIPSGWTPLAGKTKP